jgi:FkbM family methyltransferase
MSRRIEINGEHFFVEDSRYDLFWKDISAGNWEKESFKILDDFIRPESIMIDIGCWGGPLSLYAACKGARVYALDPDPAIFNHLLNNLVLNPGLSKHIHPRQIAISARSGTTQLFARKEYGLSSSSILRRARDGMKTHTCQTLNLEEFCIQEKLSKIDFIKIDIEGGEFELLAGLGENFLKSVGMPALFISFHLEYLKEHMHLSELGTFSPVTYRIAQKLKLNLFSKSIASQISKSLQILYSYPFLYTEEGRALSHDTLRQNPFLISKHNIVASTREWKPGIS